jgi:hypothetical protein
VLSTDPCLPFEFNMPDPSPAADSPGARLLADVGGTNARFAWQADRQAAIEHVYTLPAADHPTR